jgi:hypothetical protein
MRSVDPGGGKQLRGAFMPLAERVTDYTIAQLKNEVVDYQQVVRLTTETGHQAFIAFPDQPPAQWLTINGSNTTAFLERGEFDRIHHLLQTETPLFFTSSFIVGPVLNLSTSAELPGEGPADDDALAQLMATMRQHLADSGEPGSA